MSTINYEVVFKAELGIDSKNTIILNMHDLILVKVGSASYTLTVMLQSLGLMSNDIAIKLMRMSDNEVEEYAKLCLFDPIFRSNTAHNLLYTKEHSVYDGSSIYHYAFTERSLTGSLIPTKFMDCIIIPQILGQELKNRYYLIDTKKVAAYLRLVEIGVI